MNWLNAFELMCYGIVVIMFTMNWQLTLLSLVPVPFVVMGSRTFGKKIRPLGGAPQ